MRERDPNEHNTEKDLQADLHSRVQRMYMCICIYICIHLYMYVNTYIYKFHITCFILHITYFMIHTTYHI